MNLHPLSIAAFALLLGCGSTPAAVGNLDASTDVAPDVDFLDAPLGGDAVWPDAGPRGGDPPTCNQLRAGAARLGLAAGGVLCDRGSVHGVDPGDPRFVSIADCHREATACTMRCLPATLPPSTTAYQSLVGSCWPGVVYTFDQLDAGLSEESCDGGVAPCVP